MAHFRAQLISVDVITTHPLMGKIRAAKTEVPWSDEAIHY